MITTGVSDYWKLRDRGGVTHLYNDHIGLGALCDGYIRPTNMPGTLGGETVLTCIRCQGLFARMSEKRTLTSST